MGSGHVMLNKFGAALGLYLAIVLEQEVQRDKLQNLIAKDAFLSDKHAVPSYYEGRSSWENRCFCSIGGWWLESPRPYAHVSNIERSGTWTLQSLYDQENCQRTMRIFG